MCRNWSEAQREAFLAQPRCVCGVRLLLNGICPNRGCEFAEPLKRRTRFIEGTARILFWERPYYVEIVVQPGVSDRELNKMIKERDRKWKNA